MRLPFAFQLLATGALASALAACAHPPLQVAAAPPPNPYGYLRPAAVCDAPAPSLPASGSVGANMRMSADGGFCAFHFSQDGDTPYAAGLVTRVAQHGQTLIYNYNGATVVSYTPTAGYIGPDSVTIELVPGSGRPRASVMVAISVGGSSARS